MDSKSARVLSMIRLVRQSPGFTLMELLISVTLMGLLVVFIHLGFRIGINSREKAEAALQHIQTTEAALDVLSRQIGSMVPYVSRQEYERVPVEVLLFQSSPESLSFVSTYSATSRSTAGLQFVQYFSTTSKDGRSRSLRLSERPLSQDAELLGPVIKRISKTGDNEYLAELVEPKARADSLTLVEGLTLVAFRSLSRPKGEKLVIDVTREPPKMLSGRLGRLLRMTPELFTAQKKRELLPYGIKLSLQWHDQGPFGSKEFAIAVPVQAS